MRFSGKFILFVASLAFIGKMHAQHFVRNAKFNKYVWREAQGVSPKRMVSSESDNEWTLYRTIWKKADDDYLVCLRYPGCELGGTPYDVAVFNADMTIIRRGHVCARQDDTPYCIAEVMTGDEILPEQLRNKWLLAVGFWSNHFKERYYLKNTGDENQSQADIEKALKNLPAEFYFELIHWDDAKVNPVYGSGNLFRVKDLKIRWIELGDNILKRAKRNVKSPYKYSMPENEHGTRESSHGKRR